MNKIEVKRLEKQYSSCNCCEHKECVMYEITLTKKTPHGFDGRVFQLCSDCIEDLVIGINNVYE